MIITDIETNGLLDDVTKFHCAVIYDSKTDEYTRYRPNDFNSYIEALLKEVSNGGMLVFHNGYKYDVPVIEKLAKLQLGIDIKFSQENVIDTLVLTRLIYSNLNDIDAGLTRSGKLAGSLYGSHSLEAWGYRLGEMKGEYKYDFKKSLEEQGIEYTSGMEWLNFSEEMMEYNVQDVVVTKKLLEKLLSQGSYFPILINKNSASSFWEGSIYCVQLEHEVAWLLAKTERNGYPVDSNKMEQLYGELAARRSELLLKLVDTFGSWYEPNGGKEFYKDSKTGKPITNIPKVIYPKVNRNGYTKDCPYTPIKYVTFNPSSRQHITKMLLKAGWKPTEFTPSGAPKVDDEVLEHVKVDDQQAQSSINLISEYLMLQKRIGQISEGDNGWLRMIKPDGRIHGSVNPNGAVTGRATHSTPNIAQVPSSGALYGKECRQLFGAAYNKPDGWIQVGVDAAGLELRCLSHFLYPYDNGAYANVVLNGDIHTENQKAAGLPTRNNAKTFIYGFLYGAGAAKIGEIVNGTAKEGKVLITNFLEKMPAIVALRDAIQNSLVESSTWVGGTQRVKWKRKYIKGLDGRRVNIRSPHAALNSVLQSAGAIICKQWIVETERLLLEKGYKHGWDGDFAYMAWVHDEIQVAARTQSIAEDIVKLAQEAMRNTGSIFKFRCQLDTDGKIGKNWADCH